MWEINGQVGIAKFTDGVLRSTNDSKVMAAAFVDLKKAFDTVDHSTLIKKVENLGLRDRALVWSRNYLVGRPQTTFVNNTTSETLSVESPQGL